MKLKAEHMTAALKEYMLQTRQLKHSMSDM